MLFCKWFKEVSLQLLFSKKDKFLIKSKISFVATDMGQICEKVRLSLNE